MPIKIYEPTEPLPSKGPLAVPIQDESWKTVFGVAELLTEAGQRLVAELSEQRFKTEIETAETELNKWYNDFRSRMEAEPIEAWKDAFDREREKIKESIVGRMKMKRAKDAFSGVFEKFMDNYGFELQTEINKRTVEEMRLFKAENLTYWAEEGRIDKVDEIMSDPSMRKLFTPEERAKMDLGARNRIAVRLLKNYTAGLDTAEAMKLLQNRPKVNEILAGNGLRPMDISDEQIENVLRDTITRKQIEDAARREVLQKQHDEANEYLWDIFIRTPKRLTPEIIDQQPIAVGGEGGKMWWKNQLEEYARSQAALAQKEMKDFPTDPYKEAKLQQLFMDPTKSDVEVRNYMLSIANGKGLSNDDTLKYYNLIKERTPNLLGKEAIDMIDAEIGEFIKTAERKGDRNMAHKFAEDRVHVMSLFQEWWQKNKDKAKRSDVLDYINELLDPYRKEKARRVYKALKGLERPDEIPVPGVTETGIPGVTETGIPGVTETGRPGVPITGKPESLKPAATILDEYRKKFGEPTGRTIQTVGIDEKTKKPFETISPDGGLTWYRYLNGRWEYITKEKQKWQRVK